MWEDREERTGRFIELMIDYPGWPKEWRRAEFGEVVTSDSGGEFYRVKTYFCDDGLNLSMTPLFQKAVKIREIAHEEGNDIQGQGR